MCGFALYEGICLLGLCIWGHLDIAGCAHMFVQQCVIAVVDIWMFTYSQPPRSTQTERPSMREAEELRWGGEKRRVEEEWDRDGDNGTGHEEKSKKKKKSERRREDFPGGPVIKNSSVNAGDIGSIPGLGRFHMPWDN